jgi:dTDP-4-amino-4,6-dideoxygalactose transaminase
MSQNNARVYLSSPHMSGREMKYINDAFEKNWVAPLGPNVDALEETLASYCNIGYAAALSSGTAAIHLGLIILNVQPGDDVIVSTFTFSATVNPIVYQGATPVFVDSEPETWNMDPELLEKAIIDRINKGKTIRAIIPVHLYGMPANIKEIVTIGDKYGIPVMEDAAEALGSRFMGKPVGSFGKLAVLSFNGNKIITTSGGGALISDDREMIEKARFLSTQARDKAPHYQHSQIGYNYRMSNILAGIGRGQMEMIDERVKKRRENFNYYKTNLRSYDSIKFLEEPSEHYFSNHWLTTVLIDSQKSGASRQAIQNKLEENNIESRPLWKPMHLQPVFMKYPAYLNGLSEQLFESGLCLPSGTNMSDQDRDRVLKIIIGLLK